VAAPIRKLGVTLAEVVPTWTRKLFSQTGRAPESAQAFGAYSRPEHIRELLGPAPPLRWESLERYERVLASMAQAVDPEDWPGGLARRTGPKDWIEWVWTKDLVDLGWEGMATVTVERIGNADVTGANLAERTQL
jgi:hypothetical protein